MRRMYRSMSAVVRAIIFLREWTGPFVRPLGSGISWPRGNDTITVTGSFGLTEYIVGEGLDEFYQRADKACYGAKDAGRNCLVIERIEANSRSGTKEAVDRPDGTVDHGTN